MTGSEKSDQGRRQRLDEAIAEYLIDADAGRGPEREAFLARHPELRDELADFLNDQSNLARLVEPLRGSPGSLESTEVRSIDRGRPFTDPDGATGVWSSAEIDTTEDRDAKRNEDQPFDTVVRYFGDYELGKVLGRGGMGVVYRARQVSLNRPVALKMIRDAAFASDNDRRRFQNEAEAVAMLDHPGIVPIHEVGDHLGQRYFAMKLISGASLSQGVAKYKDDPKAAATLLALVAEAVHHAHMRGILHRDLKPANILVDADGTPHVTDFGLARKVDGDTEMTASGAILGTPAYMAPEQASGKRGSITIVTDVYGLGAVLYALLTGKAPFGGDSEVDTLSEVKEQPPEPPRKLNPAVPPDLEVICLKCLAKDPRRRYATARALADDLRHWLADEPIAARRVGSAERLWLWCKRRPALASLSVVIGLLIVAGSATVIAVQSRANRALEAKNAQLNEANARESSANASLREANERVQVRFDLAREAIRAFQQGVNEDDMLKGKELEGLRNKLLKSAAGFYEKLENLLKSQTDRGSQAILAQSYFELGELTAKIDRQTNALAVHRRGLAIRRELAALPGSDASTRLDLARSLIAVGTIAAATGKRAEAIAAFQESRGLTEPLATGPDPSVAARELMGDSYFSIGRAPRPINQRGEGLPAAMVGLDVRLKLAEENPGVAEYRRSVAASLESVGLLQRYARNQLEPKQSFETTEEARFKSLRANSLNRPESLASLERARASFDKALAIRRKLVEEHPATTQFLSDLADSLDDAALVRNRTETTDRLDLHRESLAIRRKLVAENPAVTAFRSRLATSLSKIGNSLGTTEALALNQEELAIRRKLAGDNPSVTEFLSALLESYHRISRLQEQIGHPAEALESYQARLAIWRKLAKGPDTSADLVANVATAQNGIAASLLRIGDLQLKMGRWAESMASYSEALAVRRKLADDKPADTEFRDALVGTHYKIGTVYLSARRFELARAAFEDAITVRRKHVHANESDLQLRRELAATYEEIAHAQSAAGQLTDALANYQACLAIRVKLAEQHPEIARARADLQSTHQTIAYTQFMTRRPAQAMASFQAALAIARSLVDDNPKNVKFRYELANIHNQIGSHQWRAGQTLAAMASFQTALAIARRLVDENPGEMKRFNTILLANIHVNMGRLRTAAGQSVAAVSEFKTAEAIYQSLADSGTVGDPSRSGPSGLAVTHSYTADALRGLGRLSEARAGYARAITIIEGLIATHPEAKSIYGGGLARSVRGLGFCLQSAGDLIGAVAAARRALAIYEGLSDDWGVPYEMACVRSTLADLAGRPGSGIPAAQAGPEADRAMALLSIAMAQGALSAEMIRTESALDLLRARQDFKLLLMDLAMPDEPLAK
jgi:tetratricopeptide (TPR) repeat protein